MAKFSIEYNPYQNKTEVSKNGVLEPQNSKMNSIMKKERLQNWFNKLDGWPGLGEVIEKENNDRKCSIVFKGRRIDFEDLQDYFTNHYKSKTQFELDYVPSKSDEDMMAAIEKLVSIAEEKEILDGDKIAGLRDTYRKLKEEPFSMSVIATMSSGKSTLFNSLLRKDFLPTGDKATTAKIVEINLDKNIKEFEAECFDAKGQLVLKKATVCSEAMKELNNESNIRKIKVYGDIPGIESNTMKLMLRDTPGPNNSQDMEHREITESVIKSDKDMSVVIYVMNATNLEVDSDKELLESIAKAMKEGGKQAKDRVLFVISKADIWIENEEQTMYSLIEDTKKYLKKFDINNPNIFPVNALLAEQIWRSIDEGITNKKTEKNLRRGIEDFSDEEEIEAHFEKFATLSPSSRKIIEDQLKEAIESDDDKKIALVHTGIPALEVAINEYLEKYAYPIRISETVKEFENIIDEKKMREEFMNLLKSSEDKLKNAKEQVKSAEKKKEERERKGEEFAKKIDSYNLKDGDKDSVKRESVNKFQAIIDAKMMGLGEKIEVEKAKSIVGALIREVNNWENETKKITIDTIENKVHHECEALLDEFREYMKDLKKSIEIEGFDIARSADFKKYDFTKVEQVSKKPTSTEGVYEEREVMATESNPDKRWWTFWRPKTIEMIKIEKEKVGEIQFVKREDIMTELTEASIQVEENINAIYKNYKEELEQFKEKFKLELIKLGDTIKDILDELNKMIKSVEEHQGKKSHYEEKVKKLDELVLKLNEVTSI